MCLGVPGKITTLLGNNIATVDVNGNQTEISIALVPEAKPEQYVLIHAGFAMELINEEIANETMYYLEELQRYASEA